MQVAKFFAKVYTSSGGAFRQTLPETRILNVPRIIREVGKPASDLTISLALPWDAFGYGDSDGINEFDLVKVYAANDDNTGGVLVYQGHVTELEGVFDAGNDHVELRLMPLDAILTQAFYKDGSAFVYSYSSIDIDQIFADVIAHANSIHGSFFTTSLGNPAKSITLDFDQKTHAQVLADAAKFLDEDWFWRINAAGQLKLAQYNDSAADHVFVVGKHVDQLRVKKSILDLKNGYRLAWGGTPTYAYYEDSTSKTNYGIREKAESDSAIGDSGSADEKGDGFIAANKDPKTITKLTINAEYAIETINAGDTCEVRGIKDTSGVMLSGVKRIKRVEYDGSLAMLDLDDVFDNFGQEFGKAVA